MVKPRTLLITKNVPWPPNSGEKQRTLGIVRCVAGLGPVTVVGYAGEHDDPAGGEAERGADLGPDPVTVRSLPLRRPAPLGWVVRTLRLRSLTAARWQQPALRQVVLQEIERGVDVVVVEHVQLAGLLPPLPDRVVSVLDMHNVESELTRRLGHSSRSWRRLLYRLEAAALARLERRAVGRFDLVTVVSEVDRDLLATRAPHDRVAVVPNAIDPGPEVLPAATTPTACFVGLLGWAPNAEAAVSFTREVWPLVRDAVPDARLLLVGRDPTPEVRALADTADGSVVVTGTVPELRPFYAQSRVALAPLLAGGGSRLKILEALAWGRPVVATPVGVEGLEDLVGRGVVTGTDRRELADLVAGLLLDPTRSADLGRAGADAVRRDHSWRAATEPLAAALSSRWPAGDGSE